MCAAFFPHMSALIQATPAANHDLPEGEREAERGRGRQQSALCFLAVLSQAEQTLRRMVAVSCRCFLFPFFSVPVVCCLSPLLSLMELGLFLLSS